MFFALPFRRRFEDCVADRASHGPSSPQPAPPSDMSPPDDDVVVDVGSVLVLLPTFNEAATITETIRRVRTARGDAQILVVDDSSPDGTADMVRAVAETNPNLFLLVRAKKDGYGPALMEGFKYAEQRGFDVVVTLDSDLSHDPAQIPDLLAAVAAGADVAVGSRYLPDSPAPQWPRRRLWLSRAGNRFARSWLRLGVSDSTGGFRAYRVEALCRAAVRSAPARGYGFLIGMLRRLVESGAAVTEVPILFKDRTAGESKMSWRIVVEALLLVLWWGIQSRIRTAVTRACAVPATVITKTKFTAKTKTPPPATQQQFSAVPLREAMTALGLSTVDIADVMGTDPRTIEWLLNGPPASRIAKIDALVEAAEMLSDRLRDGTPAEVVRRCADAYDGRTMLEVFADDDHEQLLRSISNSFDYSRHETGRSRTPQHLS